MGLCKCPKKKVTNLFCFEHRVNVCEHCLVTNHPKCVVQSYLQWLQDSDYDPTCKICKRNLSDEDLGECVRLVCYDVFHWVCLNQYAKQLPPNTAPAGYCCPACKTGIFPAPNVASPVAECLREQLSKVNWARAGLGMPLIDEPTQSDPVPSAANPSGDSEHSDPILQAYQELQSQGLSSGPPAYTSHTQYKPTPTSHSVINVEEASTYRGAADRQNDQMYSGRKLFDTRQDDFLNTSHDHDEDKYKRRPAMQWLSRWFKSRTGSKRKDPDATLKRFLIVLVIGIFGFLTVIVIFSRLGRSATENDPLLDPLANPNIRVDHVDQAGGWKDSIKDQNVAKNF